MLFFAVGICKGPKGKSKDFFCLLSQSRAWSLWGREQNFRLNLKSTIWGFILNSKSNWCLQIINEAGSINKSPNERLRDSPSYHSCKKLLKKAINLYFYRMMSIDPLHGKTLETIVTKLVAHFGWEELGQLITINCFTADPSIKSSLTFLRKTPWARKKVEQLYIDITVQK